MWQTIEMREIRVFLTLAEELHFGRTAERLGLTQSRVSQSLRALETKLGVQLFQRTSRRVVLTSTGERLLGEVAPAYEQLLGTLQRAAPGQVVEGVLRLGVIAAAAVPSNLLRVIDEFEARHPGCRVNVVELPFLGRHDPLRRGDVDIMVTRLPLTDRALVIGPVVSQEVRMVAVARDHPLGSHGTVSLEDLADHDVFDMSTLIPDEMADEFVPRTTRSGRPIRRLRIPAEDLSELVILIARGRIAHLTVASAAPRFAHSDVVCVPVTDVPPSSTALCWRRQARDQRLRAFVQVANHQLTRA
jgi:DNA-binding transcriptional LysR family regulator